MLVFWVSSKDYFIIRILTGPTTFTKWSSINDELVEDTLNTELMAKLHYINTTVARRDQSMLVETCARLLQYWWNISVELTDKTMRITIKRLFFCWWLCLYWESHNWLQKLIVNSLVYCSLCKNLEYVANDVDKSFLIIMLLCWLKVAKHCSIVNTTQYNCSNEQWWLKWITVTDNWKINGKHFHFLYNLTSMFHCWDNLTPGTWPVTTNKKYLMMHLGIIFNGWS